MRVLIVSSEFPPGPGGIGTHAYELATGLQRLGWEVSVAASQDYAPDNEVEAFNRTQAFPIMRFRPIGVAPIEAVYRGIQLGKRIKRWGPSALIASGSRSVMLAGALPTGPGPPWIAVGHGSEFGARGLWQAFATRSAFGRATAVVCVSEFTRKRMNAAGIHPSLVRIIPNGADPSRFRVLPDGEPEAFRRELGLSGARILVTVGNVTRRKGQDIVVRALPAIIKRVPDVHYLMAGLPTLGSEIHLLAEDLGVADRVHILGRIDHDRLLKLLNAADVFVMTSRHTEDGDFEGYGIAVVEAALCGRPAVVTVDSGLSEAVSHGATGLCVPSEDPAATASAILSLLEDDALRLGMGEAARERAEREQTWDRRMREYDAFLRELIAARSGGAVPRASLAV